MVVFDSEGQFLRRLGSETITNFPNGIDVSDAGDVLIGDSHGNKFHVAVFSRNGQLLSEFECPHVKVSLLWARAAGACAAWGTGSDPGEDGRETVCVCGCGSVSGGVPGGEWAGRSRAVLMTVLPSGLSLLWSQAHPRGLHHHHRQEQPPRAGAEHPVYRLDAARRSSSGQWLAGRPGPSRAPPAGQPASQRATIPHRH